MSDDVHKRLVATLSAELRQALSTAVADSGQILILLSDAGLARSRISMSGSAEIVWFNIFEHLKGQGIDATRRLLDQAGLRCPGVPEIQDALDRLEGRPSSNRGDSAAATDSAHFNPPRVSPDGQSAMTQSDSAPSATSAFSTAPPGTLSMNTTSVSIAPAHTMPASTTATNTAPAHTTSVTTGPASAAPATTGPISPGVPATPELLERVFYGPSLPLVWVGAGTSMSVGYPSLGALLDKLRHEDYLGAIPAGIDEFTEVVDRFVAAYSQGQLSQILHNLFAPSHPPGPVHHALARLAKARRIRALITTNYDPLLEHVLRDAGVSFVTRVLHQNIMIDEGTDLQLFKIHGSYSDWSAAVLSGESYRRFTAQYALLMDNLNVLLSRHPVVFVGCSMRDPRICDWLRSRPADQASQLRPWHPLLTTADWHAATAADRVAMGVGRVIPFLVDGYGAHLPALWTALADQAT